MPRIGVFGWGVVAPQDRRTSRRSSSNLESTESWLDAVQRLRPRQLPGRPARVRFRRLQALDRRALPAQPLLAAGREDGHADPVRDRRLHPGAGAEPGHRGGAHAARHRRRTSTSAPASARSARSSRSRSSSTARSGAGTASGPQPERNRALRRLPGAEPSGDPTAEVPPPPDDGAARRGARTPRSAWWHFWAGRSPRARGVPRRAARDRGARRAGRRRDRQDARDQGEAAPRASGCSASWGAPDPPWHEVSANLLWNIHNTPSAQISMLGKITGLAFAPVAACSTFGVTPQARRSTPSGAARRRRS